MCHERGCSRGTATLTVYVRTTGSGCHARARRSRGRPASMSRSMVRQLSASGGVRRRRRASASAVTIGERTPRWCLRRSRPCLAEEGGSAARRDRSGARRAQESAPATRNCRPGAISLCPSDSRSRPGHSPPSSRSRRHRLTFSFSGSTTSVLDDLVGCGDCASSCRRRRRSRAASWARTSFAPSIPDIRACSIVASAIACRVVHGRANPAAQLVVDPRVDDVVGEHLDVVDELLHLGDVAAEKRLELVQGGHVVEHASDGVRTLDGLDPVSFRRVLRRCPGSSCARSFARSVSWRPSPSKPTSWKL